jgi:hypothetical protein
VEQFSCLFDFMLPWISRVMEEGYSKESAFKIFNLITNPCLEHYLKIELTAYCMVGSSLRELTYTLEGDGELAFVAWPVIDAVLVGFRPLVTSGADLFPVPKVSALAVNAVAWAASTEGAQDLLVAQTELAQAVADLAAPPPPPVALRGVSARHQRGDNAERAARVKAIAAAKQEAEKQQRERVKELREEKVVAALAAAPPRNVAAWEAYARSHMAPAIQYLTGRIDDVTDYGNALALFEGISTFHPKTLAMLEVSAVTRCLNLLRGHPYFDEDVVIQVRSAGR